MTREPVTRFRLFWLFLGITALACGFVGVVLPILPTTPFMLLAAFAFGKSSPRLRRWLVEHRHFGPAIRDWEAHGRIQKRHKRLAYAMMAATFGISLALGVKPIVLVVQAVCLSGVAVFLATRPTEDSPPPRRKAGD